MAATTQLSRRLAAEMLGTTALALFTWLLAPATTGLEMEASL